jgi:hypothetical protein
VAVEPVLEGYDLEGDDTSGAPFELYERSETLSACIGRLGTKNEPRLGSQLLLAGAKGDSAMDAGARARARARREPLPP